MDEFLNSAYFEESLQLVTFSVFDLALDMELSEIEICAFDSHKEEACCVFILVAEFVFLDAKGGDDWIVDTLESCFGSVKS